MNTWQDDLRNARRYWDEAADSFDDEPDHGLRDPHIHQAWRELLEAWLPGGKQAALDVGCGTGSLTALLGGLGHRVTAVDSSSRMISRARAKAERAGLQAQFAIMDAAPLAFAPRSFDVIVCRHLLWALPQPERVLEQWSVMLRPNGRLMMIEGHWSTGSGLRAVESVAALPSTMRLVAQEQLSDRPELWGKRVDDERYLVIASVR
jgi:2-polyprenyl-3-methyl-5-hydroxy-6-metoxy-1,4-benzoquinol methylase